MERKFEVEDMGTFSRLHTKGPHTHESSKGANTCMECYTDLPFSTKFIEQLIDWDPHGVFHFIGERLCNDSFNEGPRNLILRFCPDLNDCPVLDFGSGLGQLSPFLFEQGAAQVILCEIDDKLVELSRTYMEDHGYTDSCTYFLVKEDDDLAMIEDESVDLIVASEVFEHILPWHRKTTLQTLYKKLKPGGNIIITTPNRLFPKDGHTTGLWFAAWLPTKIGAWYARTFASWRWKNRSTEGLLRQGLRQYSYFEARKVLKPLGAIDLCSKYPTKMRISRRRSVKSRIFYNTLNVMFLVFLKHFGPWEAWQSALEMAWSKPTAHRRHGADKTTYSNINDGRQRDE